jgi:peptidyl-prolyl cis-trans isomerase A (cyclophilin A)
VNRFLCGIFAVGALAVTATSATAKNPVVTIDTSMGTIKVELFEDKAPITVKNFLSYVDKKFYDGTIFHRVMPGFMIQGGGFEAGMSQKKTEAPIKNEAANGVSNARGTIAMARTQIPDSATAQFFINLKDNTFLDANANSAGYCAFGKVTEGMDVVDRIKDVPTGNRGGNQNVPREDVIIKSIRRAE